MFNVGVSSLPDFPKDSTDRNRTSPFAFTGNKFEFRMVGSNLNIAGPNTILNTIVANSLTEFADELEKAGEENFNEALHDLLVKTITEHKRVIFNGNGYGDEWPVEAEKRGLLNLKSTVDAIPCLTAEKNVKLFKKFGVYSEIELHARQEILLENYSKVINIEALTAADMAKTEILPAVMKYGKEICDIAASKKAVGIEPTVEMATAKKVNDLTAALSEKAAALSDAVVKAQAVEGEEQKARFYHDEVFSLMQSLRAVADELGVSESYLSRLFKKETGINFQKYLQDIKMATAISMLTPPAKYRNKEIAEALGYTDSQNFCRTFRKVYGMTPIEYRNSRKNKK